MHSTLMTPHGSTLIRRLGCGPELLIFHGGPGFDHRYLVPHLDFLTAKHTLIFFDQLGSGGTARPGGHLTFDAIRRHASCLLTEFARDGHVCIVAHSWGVAVCLASLELLPQINVEGLMVCPVPTTRERFEQMRCNLFSRIPQNIIDRIVEAKAALLSASQIAQLLPYYLSSDATADLNELSFDFGSYMEVYTSLGDFNLSAVLGRVRHCHVLMGKDDFITPDLVEDLASACGSFASIPGAGHFPFAEKPHAFRIAADRLLQASA